MASNELATRAREFAKRHIQNDVDRGISEHEIALSHHGHSCDTYWADIGLDQRYKPGGRQYPTSKIVISKIDGKDCLFVFSLHELYEECKSGQLSLI